MTTSASPTAAPAVTQKVGLFDATMLVAGSMIGSGIFIVSADIARDVGSSGWLLLVWILTGVLTIVGALSYAELAAMMPNAGGQYVFLREAYGPVWGFLYGWTCFLVIQAGFIAAVSIAFAKFLGVLVPELSESHFLWQNESIGNNEVALSVPWMGEVVFFPAKNLAVSSGQLVAVALTVFLTIVNTRGIEMGRLVQNIFTVSKLLGLGLLIVLGMTIAASSSVWHGNFAEPWVTMPALSKMPSTFPVGLGIVMVLSGAMVGSLFSADAWNNVTFIAHEVKNPHRTLPWGLLLGTGIVIVLYVLANLAYLAALPINGQADVDPMPIVSKQGDEHDEESQRRAAKAALLHGIDHAKNDRVGTAVLEVASPRLGVPLMAVVIMISTFGCVNGLTLMGPRLYYAMARDGLFFQSVGTLNKRGAPAVGLWLQCTWSIVLIFTGSYNELLDYIIFAALMFYILTVFAVFVLRWKRPDANRPYRAWGYPVLPALYIALCTVIMLSLLVVKPVFSWPSFLIVLTGIPVFFLWRGLNRPPLAA